MSENVIFAKKSLDSIFLATSQSHATRSKCTQVAELPSWCTDYLHLDARPLDERFRLGVKGKRWSATASRVATRRNIMFQNGTLRVRACHLGEIDGLSTAFNNSQHNIHQSKASLSNAHEDTSQSIWRGIQVYHVAYDKYKQNSLPQFLSPQSRELTESTELRKIQQWMSTNDSFLIPGKSLRAWRTWSGA